MDDDGHSADAPAPSSPGPRTDEVAAVRPRTSRGQRRLLLGDTASTRRGSGALLVGIGAVTVFVAVYLLPSDSARHAAPDRPFAATIALLGAIAVANVLVYGRRIPMLPGWRTTLPIAVVLLGLSAWIAVWAVRAARDTSRTGYLDTAGVVTLIGVGLIALGTLLALGVVPRARRITRAAIATAVVVAAATVVAGVIVDRSADGWTVRSSTLPPGAVTAAPGSVRRGVWKRNEAGAVVAAGGPGLVVSAGDLLRGIAADDGREVWRYERDGARIDRVVTSPDGATAYAELAEFDPSGNGVVVFDAASGERRFATNRAIAADGSNVTAAGVVESHTEDDGALRIVMRPGTVGARGWTWNGPACPSPPAPSSPAPAVVVTAQRVLVGVRCGAGPWALTVLDGATGTTAWTADVAGISGPLRIDASEGLGVVTLEGDGVGIPQVRRLLDGRAQQKVAKGYVADGLVVSTDARNVPIAVVDPRTNVSVPLTAALAPLVERRGAVLTLDRQVLTVAPTSASLRSVKVGLVDLRSGEARTVDTGLDPGDDVRLVAGPGAVYVVVRSANGDVGVAALR